jgi:hypothetical protein
MCSRGGASCCSGSGCSGCCCCFDCFGCFSEGGKLRAACGLRARPHPPPPSPFLILIPIGATLYGGASWLAPRSRRMAMVQI